MEYTRSNIQDGVHRFMQGETSLEEEEALRTYFRYAEPPEGLEDIAAYFALIDAHETESGLDESFDADMLDKIKSEKGGKLVWLTPRRWLSVAAVVIAVMTIYFLQKPNEPAPLAENTAQSQEEIRQAFDQAKAALLLMGGGLDKGRTHAVSITRFNDAQQIIKEQ